jgi:predicted phage-related endonuclease
MSENAAKAWNSTDRRRFIGGSDAPLIMGRGDTRRVGSSGLFWLRRRREAVPQKQAKSLAARFDLVVRRPFVNGANDRLRKTHSHSRIMAGSRAAAAFLLLVYRY